MKAPESTLMFREAGESAEVVGRQLQANAALIDDLVRRLRAAPPRFIVTAARGSSDHAAAFAKYVFETKLGFVTASAAPAVTSIYGAPQQLDGALYIALSQSGESPDLLRSVAAARKAGAYVVALLNVEDAPLAALADTVIPLRAGPERSVAATKSYLATSSAILQWAARWSGDAPLHAALDRLPDDLRAGWAVDWQPLQHGLADATNLYVVGRGYGYGAALEAALKLKETCGLHAEALSAAEARHGPMALVGPDFPVLFFAQDDATLPSTLRLADEFRARGARVWVAAPAGCAAAGTELLPLAGGLSPLVTPLLTAQSFYRAANALALSRGRDPDRPPHLNKVTETV